MSKRQIGDLWFKITLAIIRMDQTRESFALGSCKEAVAGSRGRDKRAGAPAPGMRRLCLRST